MNIISDIISLLMINITLDMILFSSLDNHITRPFPAAQIRKPPVSDPPETHRGAATRYHNILWINSWRSTQHVVSSPYPVRRPAGPENSGMIIP
ncbi:hypothetical protein E3355_21205 [Salmonella enterica subsp. enterica serovar Chester]|nr:hypothetical protein [Salmonella enterica subsp. enterica serovar Chester]